MDIKIKLSEGAFEPQRSNPTDAGADLRSPIYVEILPNECYFIDFGVSMEIPVGYAGFIYARSGLGSNCGIVPRNCVGVIDSKYRGNIGMMVKNDNSLPCYIHIGDRIAQIVITPIETPTFTVVDELNMEGNRGGGFGSSGK